MSDKSNAVTDDEFVEADELLASIPVEAEAMDLAEADGFMTAVQLLPKTPETKDWLPHILSTNWSERCRHRKCGERQTTQSTASQTFPSDRRSADAGRTSGSGLF